MFTFSFIFTKYDYIVFTEIKKTLAKIVRHKFLV